MYSIVTAYPQPAADGHVDLSFRDTNGWLDLPHPGLRGAKLCAVLLGDENAGPLVWLSQVPPASESMQLSPSHGHDSDNWRLSILGSQRMGKRRYSEGDFRFQNGGVAYGPDDYCSGPGGGYGIVMMADRRGFPVRTIKPNRFIDKTMDETATRLGVHVAHPYPFGSAIRTTAGDPGKAMLEGSFADSDTWPAFAPGTRLFAAILGDRAAGPLLLLIDSKPDATALRSLTLDTEIFVSVVAGSCSIRDKELIAGDIRLQECGIASGDVEAGSAGVSLALVMGDRRAVAVARSGNGDPRSWAPELAATLAELMNRA